MEYHATQHMPKQVWRITQSLILLLAIICPPLFIKDFTKKIANAIATVKPVKSDIANKILVQKFRARRDIYPHRVNYLPSNIKTILLIKSICIKTNNNRSNDSSN